MTVGQTLTEARSQAGLTVDELSERTRIRGTVIRSIEQDDYEACGGDLYVRGYVRALAGAVGIDAQPLIREYELGRAGQGASAPSARPAGTRRGTPRKRRPTCRPLLTCPRSPRTRSARPTRARRDSTCRPCPRCRRPRCRPRSTQPAGLGGARPPPPCRRPQAARRGSAARAGGHPIRPAAGDRGPDGRGIRPHAAAWPASRATRRRPCPRWPPTRRPRRASPRCRVSRRSPPRSSTWPRSSTPRTLLLRSPLPCGRNRRAVVIAVVAAGRRGRARRPGASAWRRAARSPQLGERRRPGGQCVVRRRPGQCERGGAGERGGQCERGGAGSASAAAQASASAAPAQAAARAVTRLPVAASLAFGPDGLADGDNPGNAKYAISGGASQPWSTQWYSTPQFGMLKHGTGLLLDLGGQVTVSSVVIDLSKYPGASLGSAPATARRRKTSGSRRPRATSAACSG